MQTINDRIKMIIESTGQTKTAFAETLKVSQQYISKLTKTGNPSDRLIDDICEKIKVDGELINKDWLLTGNGDITIKRTRNQEITTFFNEVLKLPDENIKRRLVAALVELDVNDWLTIEKIANNLKEKPKS